MIDHGWLTERMSNVIRWQLAHPGDGDYPDALEVPMAGQRVWGLFLGIHAGRTGNGFGANALSNVEIESYGRMAREPIRPFEFEMIRALDRAFLEAAREPVPDAPTTAVASSGDIMAAIRKGAGQGVSERVLTPALFDAMFP